MNKKEFSFCILKNPFSKKEDNIIFVTLADSPTLNFEIAEKKEFKKICKLLESMGFMQSELLTFESYDDNSFTQEEIKKFLEDNRMSYNKNLEATIIKEFNVKTKKNTEKDKIVKIIDYLKKSDVINGEKLPRYGEKINLSFYLFIECNPQEEFENLFTLTGDFNSKKNERLKKYIQPVTAEFMRVRKGNPDELYFESTFSYKEFYELIDVLYNFEFDIAKPISSQSNYVVRTNFSIIDTHLDTHTDKKIVVQVDTKKNYKFLMEWSKGVKKYILSKKRDSISIDFLIEKIKTEIDKNNAKISVYTSREDYESAIKYRDFSLFLTKKIKYLSSLESKSISTKHYEQQFLVKNLLQ